MNQIQAKTILGGAALALCLSLGHPAEGVANTRTLTVSDVTAEVRLRGNAVVGSEGVRLSDLFAGVPRIKDRILFPSPGVGQRLMVGQKDLKRIAEENDLDWQSRTSVSTTMVTRDTVNVPVAAIRDVIEQALIERFGLQTFEAAFVGARPNIEIGADEPISIAVLDIDFDSRTQHFVAKVSAPANDPAAPRYRMTGRVHQLADVPILRRNILPGEIIQASDIAWKSERVALFSYNTVLDVEKLIGYAARRPISGGRPIRASDIKPQILVEKGAMVTVTYRTASMAITTRGKAMERGIRGNTIRIKNLKTDKVIYGQVIGADAVTIAPATLARLN